jgi:hypothetical protein
MEQFELLSHVQILAFFLFQNSLNYIDRLFLNCVDSLDEFWNTEKKLILSNTISVAIVSSMCM